MFLAFHVVRSLLVKVLQVGSTIYPPPSQVNLFAPFPRSTVRKVPCSQGFAAPSKEMPPEAAAIHTQKYFFPNFVRMLLTKSKILQYLLSFLAVCGHCRYNLPEDVFPAPAGEEREVILWKSACSS